MWSGFGGLALGVLQELGGWGGTCPFRPSTKVLTLRPGYSRTPRLPGYSPKLKLENAADTGNVFSSQRKAALSLLGFIKNYEQPRVGLRQDPGQLIPC